MLNFVVKQCYQTKIGQKLVGNAKIETLKWDILGDFQTPYVNLNWIINIFDHFHFSFEEQFMRPFPIKIFFTKIGQILYVRSTIQLKY